MLFFVLMLANFEAGTERLELREWTEKGQIADLDCKDRVGKT